MKTTLLLAIAASALLASSGDAQTVVRETTTAVHPTDIVGTVTELAPDAVVVRTQEATEPIRYTFTKTTEYVDEAGNRLTQSVVKSGVPVTIRYVKEGDRLVVNRVIVRKQTTAPAEAVTTKKTTTTTTTTATKDKDKD